jgi:hypothetical protein
MLTERGRRGLARYGDLIIPGTDEMPSFSSSGCMEHLDSVTEHMDAADASDLQQATQLLAWMPRWMQRLLMQAMKRDEMLPAALGRHVRIARFNLRALILVLYYGHPPVLEKLSYDVSVAVRSIESGGSGCDERRPDSRSNHGTDGSIHVHCLDAVLDHEPLQEAG